jgi:Holliday junction resolvase RusA-like endonuclease
MTTCLSEKRQGFVFFAPGIPVPQGNLKPFTYAGQDGKVRASMPEGTKGLHPWRASLGYVALMAKQQSGQRGFFSREAVVLRVEFIFPRPKSLPKYVRDKVSNPDLSKLVRAVEDAITGILIRDDAQVVRLDAGKRYVQRQDEGPGAIVVVEKVAAS